MQILNQKLSTKCTFKTYCHNEGFFYSAADLIMRIFVTLRHFTDAEIWCIYKTKKYPTVFLLKETLLDHFSASHSIYIQHWTSVFD